VRCRIPRPPHKKSFTQLVGIELAGAMSRPGVFVGSIVLRCVFVGDLRGRETHPDDPPAAGCFACAFYFREVAACTRYRSEDLRMYIQGFDSAPAEEARAVAAQAFGEEGARVRDIG